MKMKLKFIEKKIGETRAKILANDEGYFNQAINEIIRRRREIERYIEENPKFKESLKPLSPKRKAPEIIKRMCHASKIFKVGPMAAVAGIIAEFSARKMAEAGAKSAIVENGGDIYAITEDEIIIGLFSNTRFDNLAFVLKKEDTPISICSSSSLMGHSLSFGRCDLAIVFSRDSAIADCGATKLANLIKDKQDLEKSLNYIISKPGVLGAVAIKDDSIGMVGELPQIITHRDRNLKKKVTKEPTYFI